MVWRDSFPPASEQALDAETERERRLAAQARAGADWALTALIARYQPAVTRYLTRLCGDPDRARELAERVFERMGRRLHGPHGADNLRLWLLRASTEAGLETLRHPRPGQRPPRLDSARVAGLLPPVPGAEPQQASRGGISRLRNVVGSVNRQARPLVWRASEATPRATTSQSEPAREATDAKPVDQSPETLDPREALRHRLVRMTLAELTYGDAQCLALHLVAGLNQAEVARALGITGSAARKRIVHGLAQFSQRYQAAVESLGLPEELGYGDALPRRIEEEGPVSIPEPEPVIVPESPEEMVAETLAPAPATTPLVVDSFDDEGERVSGVAYYEDELGGEQPAYPESRSAFPYRGSDGEAQLAASHMAYTGFDADAAAPTDSVSIPPYAASRRTPPIAIEIEDGPETPPASMQTENTEAADTGEPVAPHAHAGVVTRIAADAIVGPVVDALPVHSEPLAMSPGLGSPGPRSTPLVYELASGDAETGEAGAGGITMNWIDSTGMMAPLSFEAIITSASAGAESEEDGDTWERSMALELESPIEPEVASAPATADDAEERDTPPDGLIGERLDIPPPLDLSIALTEGDYGWTSWEPSRQDMASSEPSGDSLAYEMRIPVGQTTRIFGVEPPFDDAPGHADAQPLSAPPSTQTLEDLWDEASDTHGR